MDTVEMPADTITAEIMGNCGTPVSDDHDEKFGVPSLEELGKAATTVFLYSFLWNHVQVFMSFEEVSDGLICVL